MRTVARLLFLLTAASALYGCASKQKTDLDANDTAETATTGYWYLGDNGQKQWRVIENNSIADQQEVRKIRPKATSPFGAGSGR